jgi:hypothetical protein
MPLGDRRSDIAGPGDVGVDAVRLLGPQIDEDEMPLSIGAPPFAGG